MAAQGISEKDAKLLETKPLLVIIKYLTITIVVLVTGGVAFFFHMEGKVAAADSAKADAFTKLITAKDENAANLKEFNSVISALKYHENSDTHNNTSGSGNSTYQKR